jgi:hypothetical protein
MERLASMARPTFRSGRWHKARVSAKNLARHRKQALAAGEEWPLERPSKPLHINPLAGRKRILQRPEREAEIQARLARMPEIIEEYRQYLIQSKTDAYEKRELHVYFDADLVRLRLRLPPSPGGPNVSRPRLNCVVACTARWAERRRHQGAECEKDGGHGVPAVRPPHSFHPTPRSPLPAPR